MVRSTVNIFGTPIDIVTLDSGLERFISLLEKDNSSLIFTPNTEIIMMSRTDRELKEALLSSDMNLPDGIGLIIASKIHRLGLIERVPGVEMMGRILEFCNSAKRSIYILGGKPGVPDIAVVNIKKHYPNIEIKGYNHGYFNDKDEIKIIEEINEMNPDVLFVGLGAPKQEKWITKHRDNLEAKVAMGVGGSIDIWAGTAKRAPNIFQRLGLEWFYRLLREPWRAKRMFALPKFLLKVLFTKNITD